MLSPHQPSIFVPSLNVPGWGSRPALQLLYLIWVYDPVMNQLTTSHTAFVLWRRGEGTKAFLLVARLWDARWPLGCLDAPYRETLTTSLSKPGPHTTSLACTSSYHLVLPALDHLLGQIGSLHSTYFLVTTMSSWVLRFSLPKWPSELVLASDKLRSAFLDFWATADLAVTAFSVCHHLLNQGMLIKLLLCAR